MLIVIRADELADVLPDLAGSRPSSRCIRCVPHHAIPLPGIFRFLQDSNKRTTGCNTLALQALNYTSHRRRPVFRTGVRSGTRLRYSVLTSLGLFSVTRAGGLEARPLALTSYLYCFILNHEQLGRDLHHTLKQIYVGANVSTPPCKHWMFLVLILGFRCFSRWEFNFKVHVCNCYRMILIRLNKIYFIMWFKIFY